MSNQKKELGRRKFIRNLSLSVVGSNVSKNDFNLKKTITINGVENDFMLKKGLTYFNTGSLGPSPKRVFDKVFDVTKKLEEDPVSNNWGQLGREADEVREEIAKYINADKEEVILTRNTTEGMNLVAGGLKLEKGDEIITSTDEHYGGEVGWEFLEKYHGVIIKKIDFPKENITSNEVVKLVKEQISPRTKVCSLMDVSTITGMR
ncbi:aminotransferase class V-fold PLP-dependent enzyme, partial [Tenacibaculum sp.]|nr:aminotransferase class V-fold PLP-dependent enzyme [Tenacibaculum sp.]